jgi:uroporphyrinogen-III synthase
MHILVTRPATEAQRTARQFEAMGHRVTLAPLLDVVTLRPTLVTDGAQAIAVTSRNAIHALASHPQSAKLRALPVLAVGKSTAAAAREAGFTVALEGDAGGAELAGLIIAKLSASAGPLLHIGGETVAFDLASALQPAGFTVRRAVVYRSEPIDRLPDAVTAALSSGILDAVLLMSPRTSEAWCRLVVAAGLSDVARQLRHLCLSPGVAAALAPLGPPYIEIAVKPNEEQMLALAARLSSSSANID